MLFIKFKAAGMEAAAALAQSEVSSAVVVGNAAWRGRCTDAAAALATACLACHADTPSVFAVSSQRYINLLHRHAHAANIASHTSPLAPVTHAC
jgi:hypothetical protein